MTLPIAFQDALTHCNRKKTDHCLYVNVADQQLTHFQDGREKVFPISTAVNGTGQQMNSFMTPLGLHEIAEKIGENEPVGTVFEGRKPARNTGKGDPDALITNRILWLRGLEVDYNSGGSVDSYRRYIYIHGVGDESLLGQPNSQGCIHLAAADLIPMFETVSIGSLVFISEN